jgi:hypothetical protein
MRKLFAGLILLAWLASPALAQRVQAPSNTAVVCAYNSSPPTLTSGWFGYVQCDSAGKLITTASGGGGGAVTIADGADVTQGALADAASSAGGAGSLSAKLRLMTTQLGTINTTLGSPFQAGGSIGNTTFAVTNVGTFPVQATLAAGSSIIGNVRIDQTTPGTTNGVQVNAALPAGSNVIGHVIADTGSTTAATQATAANLNATVVGTGTFVTQSTLAAETTKVIGTVNQGTSPWVVSGTVTANGAVTNAGTFAVQPTPTTTGGLSTYFVQPTASDNHVVIKAGAGQIYYVLAMNNSATVNYIRFYDATTGFNGCNSATNLITQIQVPASTSVGGVSIPLSFGLAFATGISICVTSGYATNDTTNATATAMSITVGYK